MHHSRSLISASLRALRGSIPAWLVFSLCCSFNTLHSDSHLSAAEINFEKQVAPILVQNCVKCHYPAKARAGLNLSTREQALKGSDAGEVLFPGKPEESLLIKRAADGSMPPETDGRRLTTDEVALLTAWVKEGANWPEGLSLAPVSAKGATPTALRGRVNAAENLPRRTSLVSRVLQHFRARRNLSAAE
ncbi:MAG: c-type cytochrome domain-containing protein [Pirellulaceae bacterium]